MNNHEKWENRNANVVQKVLLRVHHNYIIEVKL